jgi:hypothetical protein
MHNEEMIQKSGEVAEEILELKAEALRKRKHLRRAGRERNGFVRYTGPEKSYSPVADPVAKQAGALGELNKRAGEYRLANPSLSPEQCFARIYSDPSNSRACPG